MSQYVTSPYKQPVQQLIQGKPEYVYGGYNDKTVDAQGYIISDSGTGSVSTVVYQQTQGNLPIPGSLVTIIGSANAAGAYNVTNVVLTAVSANDYGVVTISFAGSGSSASAPDSGQVRVPVIEIGDNLTAALVSALPYSSVPVAAVVGATVVGRATSATVTFPANSTAFPSTLTGVTVNIQAANFDRDDHFNTIGVLTAAGSAGNSYDWQSGQGVPTAPSNAIAVGNVDILSFRFYRLQITVATGAGYVVGSIMQ
jgi:hypothetical protein